MGAPSSLRNIKYTKMHHFQKKNSKIFSLEGPRENVWGEGGAENVFPGPAVALDGPAPTSLYFPLLWDLHVCGKIRQKYKILP